jgi:hypothetical protein
MRFLLAFIIGVLSGVVGKQKLQEALMSADERLLQKVRKQSKEREARVELLEQKWQDKFDQAHQKMVEGLDLFGVPLSSELRDSERTQWFRGLCQGEVMHHFHGSGGRFADRIGHIITVLERSATLSWGDGSSEGEWVKYVIKEIWWPLLKELALQPDSAEKKLSQEIRVLERTLEVMREPVSIS